MLVIISGKDAEGMKNALFAASFYGFYFYYGKRNNK